MAKPSKFAHVVYSTRRYEEMVDWYQKVFEATVAYQNPAFAFLTYDDEHHRFAFANLGVLSPSSDAETRGKEGVTTSLTLREYCGAADDLRAAQRNGHPSLLAHPPWDYSVALLP